ncbi:gliding motility lipoprotein GldH [Pedobacter ginsengisoli]|uniref:Gliding motility lipoprotein GldH n=1 Tax=Pedobacter ginsengisoli TaxID=363852 RepID=A0A2D1U9W0_9SPHI|nr:gliding motility lipoprotein GldH [Pedobacter ginsengisoli]ATP58393.1 gliding motility lipoprotein GldH [Pedobacter ginsengisoli]
MIKLKVLLLSSVLMVLFLSGCDTNTLIDSNMSMPARNWSYPNKVKTLVEITDSSKPYNVYFKLRHTADYRYSNIFVLFHITGGGQKKHTRRYEYRLAQPDGQWNGSGSGNLFTYNLPLLTNYRFPAKGKYLLEVEQNMRDNPLAEISDAGIKVELKQGQ